MYLVMGGRNYIDHKWTFFYHIEQDANLKLIWFKATTYFWKYSCLLFSILLTGLLFIWLCTAVLTLLMVGFFGFRNCLTCSLISYAENRKEFCTVLVSIFKEESSMNTQSPPAAAVFFRLLKNSIVFRKVLDLHKDAAKIWQGKPGL